MDILILIKDLYIDFIYTIPIGITSYLLRMSLFCFLCLAVLVSVWFFSPWRSVFLQTCIAFTCFSSVLYVPIENVKGVGKDLFSLIVGIAFLSLLYIPKQISFYLSPRLGTQIKIKRIICISNISLKNNPLQVLNL